MFHSEDGFPRQLISALEHLEQLRQYITGPSGEHSWCMKLLKKIIASVSPHNAAFKIFPTVLDLLIQNSRG